MDNTLLADADFAATAANVLSGEELLPTAGRDVSAVGDELSDVGTALAAGAVAAAAGASG